MLYRQVTEYCPKPSHALWPALTNTLERLKQDQDPCAEPILHAWRTTTYLPALDQLAADIRGRFSHVVIVGAGGSGLGGRVLSCLAPGQKPALHFLENIDPYAIHDTLTRAPLHQTCFIFVSKSGGTVETLAHFYVIAGLLEKELGKDQASQHMLVITMNGENPLRNEAEKRRITVLAHASDIGGRFSVFTNVGLLPAAIAGLDTRAVLRGAAGVAEALKAASHPQDVAPALGAALQYSAMQSGKVISVMLPYAQRLEGFSSWYRQSWAESLGKNGKGTTPIRAVGSTDQHSQLQLYLGGPKDKFFSMILLSRAGTGQPIGALSDPALSYLSLKTTGDVIAAQQQATLATLIGAGAPVRVIEIDVLNEESLGALLAHFTLEIIFMGALLEVNPFDQPAVEESKHLARDYLLRGSL